MPADAASPIVTVAVSVLLSLFGGGSLVALLRVRADRGLVIVQAAQGALVVQTGVVENLQEELSRLKGQVAELLTQRSVDDQEMRELRAENRLMRRRLEQLERPDSG